MDSIWHNAWQNAFFQFASVSWSIDGSSRCGDDFDEYVRRVEEEPFPSSDTDPVSRTLEFWKDRKLKIYTETGDVKQGRILEWIQSSVGPHSNKTDWDVIIVFEREGTLEKGDAVEIDGGPKTHHGKTGTVVKSLLSAGKLSGKFKICLDEDKLKFVTVHKENLIQKKLFQICRMNIEGGGTLKLPSGTLLSLEWMDPPQPMIDLHPDYFGVNCPTCRASQPAESSLDDTVSLTKVSVACPICLTDQPCRILQVCNHNVCPDCWKQWRETSTSNIPIAEPVIEADALQKERDINYQQLKALLPHTQWGGTATRPNTRRSNLQSIEAALQRYRCRISSICGLLVCHGTHGEESSLKEFWTIMRQMSIHIFCTAGYMEIARELRSMAAVEITIRVLEERADDIVANLHSWGVISTNKKTDDQNVTMPQQKATAYLEFLYIICCDRMGELYENKRKFDAAIHWYQRALEHCKKYEAFLSYYLDEECELIECLKPTLRKCYNALGGAQKRAYLLSQSLESYNAAMEYCTDDDETSDSEDRTRSLKLEISSWTGTSGRLTPGL